MFLRLGFRPSNNSEVIKDKNERVINLAAIILPCSTLQECKSRLRTVLRGVCLTLEESDSVVFSNTPLYRDLRVSQYYASYNEELDNALQECNVLFVKFFRDRNYPILTKYAESDGLPNISSWENKLYVRYGNVELRALYSYLFRVRDLKPSINQILNRLDEPDFMYLGRYVPGNWLSSGDTSYNIRRMCTNAGFYGNISNSETFLTDFKSWAEKYLAAINDCDYLFPYQGAYPNFSLIEAELWRQYGNELHYISFPEPQGFYDSLEGKNILFVSPFSEQLNDSYQSGDMFKLYYDIKIPDFNFKAIPSFLTTFPNRVHGGWTETFEKVCEMIDKQMCENSHDLFFASCGCYGLPVCHYVHKKYGIPSVYRGNIINTLFGVRQKTSEGFMKEQKDLSRWRDSHLRSVAGLERIDNGRYI